MVNQRYTQTIDELPSHLRFTPGEVPITRDSEYKSELLSLEKEKRLGQAVDRRLAYWLGYADKWGTCKYCWIHSKACLCKSLPLYKLKHKLIVLMHYKEFFRASNSGKMLLSCLDDTELIVSGLDAHEEHFDRLIEANKDNIFVLFPSSDSKMLPEFALEHMHRHREAQGEAVDHTQTTYSYDDIPPLTMIVLDGTWRQARNLNRRIPEWVPRVMIDYDGSSLFNPLRKQSQEGRISTLETVVETLSQLGATQEFKDDMTYQFKHMVDVVLMQASQGIAYGTIPKKARKSKDHPKEEEQSEIDGIQEGKMD